jgi:carbonic anhydrase
MKQEEYNIRPPLSASEWSVIPGMLLDYRNEFDDETCFTSFEEEMADIRNVYTAPGSHLLLAVENSNNKIVGCVGMRTLSHGIAEMKRLYVIPTHRGFQLGKKLATEIMAYAEEKKYDRMLLDTMYEMRAAQKLYEQLGFTIIEPYNDQDTSKVVCFQKIFI